MTFITGYHKPINIETSLVSTENLTTFYKGIKGHFLRNFKTEKCYQIQKKNLKNKIPHYYCNYSD